MLTIFLTLVIILFILLAIFSIAMGCDVILTANRKGWEKYGRELEEHVAKCVFGKCDGHWPHRVIEVLIWRAGQRWGARGYIYALAFVATSVVFFLPVLGPLDYCVRRMTGRPFI